MVRVLGGAWGLVALLVVATIGGNTVDAQAGSGPTPTLVKRADLESSFGPDRLVKRLAELPEVKAVVGERSYMVYVGIGMEGGGREGAGAPLGAPGRKDGTFLLELPEASALTVFNSYDPGNSMKLLAKERHITMSGSTPALKAAGKALYAGTFDDRLVTREPQANDTITFQNATGTLMPHGKAWKVTLGDSTFAVNRYGGLWAVLPADKYGNKTPDDVKREAALNEFSGASARTKWQLKEEHERIGEAAAACQLESSAVCLYKAAVSDKPRVAGGYPGSYNLFWALFPQTWQEELLCPASEPAANWSPRCLRHWYRSVERDGLAGKSADERLELWKAGPGHPYLSIVFCASKHRSEMRYYDEFIEKRAAAFCPGVLEPFGGKFE